MALATPTHDGWDIRIKVVPGAKQACEALLLGDRLKVRVRAPPEDGRANDAVCALLMRVTGASRAQVVAGHASPLKTIRLQGGDVACLEAPPPTL
jgi:uncharacterized protein